MRSFRRRAAAPLLTMIAAFVVVSVGCSDEDPDDVMGPSGESEVQLTAAGFPAFAQGEGQLELWISFAVAREGARRHATSASAGKFRVREGGEIVGTDYQPTVFTLDRSDPDVPLDGEGNVLWALAVDAFVTIEAADDPEPDEPGPAFAGGPFLNRTASLVPSYSDALGETFLGISGAFLLATPSTSATTDETEGVWFVAPGGSAGSLVLPVLTGDWVYEGWVSNNSAGVTSLGRFNTPGGPDTDGSGPLQGTPAVDGPGYSFPGSDFPFGEVAVDLGAASVFVTLEPVGGPDGAGPFFLELMGAPVGSAVPGTSVPMIPGSPFPSLSVTIPSDG